MKRNNISISCKKTVLLTVSFIFSWLGTDAVRYVLKINSEADWLNFSNSIISCVLFGLFAFLIYRAGCKIDKRRYIFSIIIGVLISASFIIGTSLYQQDISGISEWKTYLKILEFTPVGAAVIANLFMAVEYLQQTRYLPKFPKFQREFLPSYKFMLILWAVIFVCWLPTFLAAYPGVYAYDANFQMRQLEIGLNSHHPIAHTLFMGGFTLLGKKLFGSYEAGFALHSIVQMLIMSLIFSYICHYIAKRKAPLYLQILTWVFFALNPFHSILAVSGIKDVLFSGFFMLCFVFILDIVQNPERFFKSWKLQLRLCLGLFLMFIFRNNGFYAFLVFVPFFIVLFRKYWKKAILICLICIVMQQLYFGPFQKLLNVSSGMPQEMLSVPIQQLARVMHNNSNELTEEEKAWITEMVPAWERYLTRISDSTKNSFNNEKFQENPIEFLKKWVKIGIKCPITYIDSFLCNSFGFWYMDMIYPDPKTYHNNYIEYDMTVPVESCPEGEYIYLQRQSKLPGFSDILRKFAVDAPQNRIPVLSMLFEPGVMFWALFLYIAICIYCKKYKWICPAFLGIGLWITLLLGPAVLVRYAYPLFTMLPLELMVILTQFRKTPPANAIEAVQE